MSSKQDITEADAKFIFEQAEKYLKNSFDIGTTIANRTSTLITLSLAIIAAFVGYVIKHFDETHAVNNIALICILGSAYLLAVLIYTAKNIQPNDYYVIGSLPCKLFVDAFFKDGKPEDRIVKFYVSEITSYQQRIDKNEEKNAARWRKYKITVWALMILPIFLLSSFYLINIMHYTSMPLIK